MESVRLLPRQLEYFMTVYDMRDYSQAAQSIPISYQGIRRSMKVLEDEVGAKLFASQGGKIEPTPYADLLYELGQKWVGDVREMERAFGRVRFDERIVVPICADMGCETLFGESFPDSVSEECPGVRVTVDAFPDSETESLVSSKTYDLGIVYAPFSDELSHVVVGSLGSCLFVNREHRLASRAEVSIADLAGERLMLPDSRFKGSLYLQRDLRRQGVEPAELLFCHNPLESFLFALQGRGVGMGTMELARAFSMQREVAALPLVDGFPYEYGLVWRKGYEFSEPERMVADFLVNNGITASAL